MDTIRENLLELTDSSLGTNGYVRIVGADGSSYRMAIQDFINLVSANPSIAELITAEAEAREAADEALAVNFNGQIETLTAAIASEAELRAAADLSEAQARASADAAINEALDALDGRVDTAEGDISELKADLSELETETGDALATKAEIDGYYEEMTVGDAEQLVATQFIEDSVPYLYRTSGGSADIGNREYDEIVGGSCVWNQLLNDVTDHVVAEGTNNTVVFTPTVRFLENHKYIALVNQSVSLTSATRNRFGYSISGGNNYQAQDDLNGGKKSWIFSSVGSGSGNLMFWAHTPSSDVTFSKPQLFDLTAMFGTAIADYLYTLESATAGAGIAKLKSWGFLQKDYYEYNAGEMMHVGGISAHEMVGFNQWDEEWELGTWNTNGQKADSSTAIRCKNYIPVLPDTTYYLYCGAEFSSGIIIQELDKDKSFVATQAKRNATFVTSDKTHYIVFCSYAANNVTTYNNDICINLSWSDTRNGEYEPYVKHSYPLDSSLTLRGIPKLDASNNLYYDGDTYASDGTVTRKYGVVDLGTLSWSYAAATETRPVNNFYSNISNLIPAVASDNVVCNKFIASKKPVGDRTIDGAICTFNGRVYVSTNAYTDAATFKAAMSGVMLVYELATPTTEQATPYNEVQIVDDWGTEEYVTDSIVPVGHNTRYPQNLRDKLQHLPNLASSDGFYLIQQDGTQMELVAFHIPKATGLADGTYTLKATVSGGTPTYTWEADTNE